jgi:uncharacterized membrane protein (UPF0127 family)
VRILLAAALALSACQARVQAETPAPARDAGPSEKQVVIRTSSGKVLPVRVEVAADPATQERGLMFRRELGAEDGMLFVFKEDRDHTFWMRNTLIPLDMIFIRTDGSIAGIVPEATPLTETPRGIGVPTRYVLEVNGGWAARKGVKAGDKVVLTNALP